MLWVTEWRAWYFIFPQTFVLLSGFLFAWDYFLPLLSTQSHCPTNTERVNWLLFPLILQPHLIVNYWFFTCFNVGITPQLVQKPWLFTHFWSFLKCHIYLWSRRIPWKTFQLSFQFFLSSITYCDSPLILTFWRIK